MSKKYLSKDNLNQRMLSGVRKLYDNVSVTLGPKGNNVILHAKGHRPIITKDGVTIAKFIDFEDHFENAAVQILKQVSAKTNEDAGDGTTTSTVLAADMYERSLKYITHGYSPTLIKRGMDKACEDALQTFRGGSKEIKSLEQIEQIATISANGDETVGKLISTAIDKIGTDGAISIEESRSADTTLDVIEGFIIDSGYTSPSFVTNERRKSVDHEDCLIFVTDRKLSTVEEMMPVLEVAARESKPLVIVADEVEGQLLAALIMNAVRGSMKVVAIKPPRYGEERRNIMKDLCIATGAEFITRESGFNLKDFNLNQFGRAKRVEVLKNSTTVLSGYANYEKMDAQISLLKDQIKSCDDEADARTMQERLNRLASGVGIIRVGGSTEVEMIEKKHRVEDALEAVRSAQVNGIHAGGGAALVHTYKKLLEKQNEFKSEDEKVGYDIVLESLLSPFKTLANNATVSPDIKLEKVLSSTDDSTGCNFLTGEITDMYEAGIIDPVKVSACALMNAVSAASVLITTSHAIVEE